MSKWALFILVGLLLELNTCRRGVVSLCMYSRSSRSLSLPAAMGNLRPTCCFIRRASTLLLASSLASSCPVQDGASSAHADPLDHVRGPMCDACRCRVHRFSVVSGHERNSPRKPVGIADDTQLTSTTIIPHRETFVHVEWS